MDYSSSDDDAMALYAMENSGRPTSGRVGGLQTYVHTPKSDAHPDVALVVVHQCTAMGGCALAAEDIASACCHRGGFLTVGFDMRGAGRSKGCCTSARSRASRAAPRCPTSWPSRSGCATSCSATCGSSASPPAGPSPARRSASCRASAATSGSRTRLASARRSSSSASPRPPLAEAEALHPRHERHLHVGRHLQNCDGARARAVHRARRRRHRPLRPRVLAVFGAPRRAHRRLCRHRRPRRARARRRARPRGVPAVAVHGRAVLLHHAARARRLAPLVHRPPVLVTYIKRDYSGP